MRSASAALHAKDSSRALALLSSAQKLDPTSADVQYNRSIAFRQLDDRNSALAALDAALALEPYHLPAMLSKGALLEDEGRKQEAAIVFQNALMIAPSAARIPPQLANVHARALAAVNEEKLRFRSFLVEEIDDARTKYGRSETKRFDECLEIFTGHARAHFPKPSMLLFPGLPPVGFFDRSLSPWLEKLEEATPVIQAELADIVASSAADEFTPYVAYPAGAPVNQWGELNHSKRWSSYFLWNDGVKFEDACRRAPKTAIALDQLPLLDVPGFGPVAMFSSLAPHTHIPPHAGSTNIRSVVHLPLVLPGPAWFRVGNERREWRMGEAWMFDDTIEHEAMNDADQTRTILIIDVWNPYLSEPERALVSLILQGMRTYRRGAAKS